MQLVLCIAWSEWQQHPVVQATNLSLQRLQLLPRHISPQQPHSCQGVEMIALAPLGHIACKCHCDVLLANGFKQRLQVQIPALGAAVAALGLSNKAVYAEDMQDSNGGVASGMEDGNYTEGPDMAPNAAPAAVAG